MADVASSGVARYLGATEVLELFSIYAARDFRSISHKAIYLANSWRTLQTIGWEHAERALRSLACALLNHDSEPNPSVSDLAPDRSWKSNSARPPWKTITRYQPVFVIGSSPPALSTGRAHRPPTITCEPHASSPGLTAIARSRAKQSAEISRAKRDKRTATSDRNPSETCLV